MRTIVTALALGSLAYAAPASAGETTQNWETVTVNVALPSSFKIQNETVFRSSNVRGFYELENNFMIGRKVSKKTTLWLGYTFDPQYTHGTFTIREHRFRQQVSVDNVVVIGKIKIGGRMRLEERWREGIAGTGWRLRPQVKASMPFIGKSTIAVSTEPFINLNTTPFQGRTGLERMRNAISVAVPVSKQFTFDIGYLNQHGFVRNGPDTSDHVLTLGLTASF